MYHNNSIYRQNILGFFEKIKKMLILSLLRKHDNASNVEKRVSVCPAEVRHKALLYLD